MSEQTLVPTELEGTWKPVMLEWQGRFGPAPDGAAWLRVATRVRRRRSSSDRGPTTRDATSIATVCSIGSTPAPTRGIAAMSASV